MPLLTQNINWLWSSVIIDEFIKQGVTHFYISPGMRNAPLIAAIKNHLAHRRELFCDIVIDERAAAYRALGHAKASARPAVIVCTSGTALANYMPAVVEASKSRCPIIVISTDRPKELIDANANQTIEQEHFYHQYAKCFLGLNPPSMEVDLQTLRGSIANLYARSLLSSLSGPGPVHLNIPFREPLDGSADKAPLRREQLEKYLQNAIRPEQKYTDYFDSYPQSPALELQRIWSLLEQSPRTLFVIGELTQQVDIEQIDQLIHKLKAPLHIDVSSSLKYRYGLDLQVAPSFDHPEVYQQYQKWSPQVIVHLGGRTTSKHYYRFLKSNPQIQLISINDSPLKDDPSMMTSMRLITRPDVFARDLTAYLQANPQTLQKNTFSSIDWGELVAKKEAIIEQAPLCYPVISKKTIELIAEGSSLYIGNSTVIRSFDSYASQSVKKKLQVITHRGASGIEGLIAAALGHVETTQRATTLVIGDVSAIHDMNSLLMLHNKKLPLIIIIANNGGGGIFTLLPLQEKELILEAMLSSHQFSFSSLAESLQLRYRAVDCPQSFENAYRDAQKNILKNTDCGVQIIEAHFEHQQNEEIYQKLRTITIH